MCHCYGCFPASRKWICMMCHCFMSSQQVHIKCPHHLRKKGGNKNLNSVLLLIPVDYVFQNGGQMQHRQVPGPVQCPARTEDQQCCCVQGGGHYDQYPPAPGDVAQHDGPQLPPALQANLWPHPPALQHVRLHLSIFLILYSKRRL